MHLPRDNRSQCESEGGKQATMTPSPQEHELDVQAGKFLVLARGTPEMIAHAHVVLGTTGASLLAAHAA